MPGRPPLAEAREAATKALKAAHAVEFSALVDKYLADHGWGQQEQTVKKWVRTETT